MKRIFHKFIALLLVAMLTLVCVSVLVACNNDGVDTAEQEKQARAQSVADVKDAFLRGVNKSWSGNMKDDKIAALKDAGEYVVTAGWTDLVCDVLSESKLQTAKIKALATTMKSEDGKALISNFSENAELLISLVRDVGFTSVDISNLVYDLMTALVDRSGKVIDNMLSKLNTLKARKGISVDTALNINAYIANLYAAKATYVPTATEKKAMLAAFSAAKKPLGELAAFAYNSSINAISDNMLDALLGSDGALDDISDGEISTLVNTLLLNVADLKSTLTANSIEKLNVALNLIIKKFDNNTISSVLYAQIVKYAKYAYMVVDVIPVVCDIVASAGKVVAGQGFIPQLKDVLLSQEGLDSKTSSINMCVVMAKIMLQVMSDFTEDELKGIITRLGENSSQDYQKAVPILGLDVMLNIKSIITDANNVDGLHAAHSDIIDSETLGTIFATIFFLNGNLDKFKQAYYDYTVDKITFAQLDLAATGCSFGNFNIVNPYTPSALDKEKTAAWFEYYMTEGMLQINETVSECLAKCVDDLKEFVSEYYAENSESSAALRTIAGWSYLSEDLSEDETAAYTDVMMNSPLFGIFAAVMSME